MGGVWGGGWVRWVFYVMVCVVVMVCSDWEGCGWYSGTIVGGG